MLSEIVTFKFAQGSAQFKSKVSIWCNGDYDNPSLFGEKAEKSGLTEITLGIVWNGFGIGAEIKFEEITAKLAGPPKITVNGNSKTISANVICEWKVSGEQALIIGGGRKEETGSFIQPFSCTIKKP